MVKKVIINEKLSSYLENRNLLKQYKKAKKYILNGDYKSASFKIRQPKNAGMYYFKINEQFRRLGKIIGDTLFVTEISNHQD